MFTLCSSRPPRGRILLSIAAGALVGGAAANVNLELRPASKSVNLGDPVQLELYAVSDSAGNQTFTLAAAVITWDPAILQMTGVDNTGAAPSFNSDFIPTSPLNEQIPPQDGDGYYGFASPLGMPTSATPAGTLLTTFEFVALDCTDALGSDVAVVPGTAPDQTRVNNGIFSVLGVIGPAIPVEVLGLAEAPSDAAVDRDEICAKDGGTIELSSTGGSGDTLNWYDDACGGNLIGSGSPLVIAAPTQTTTYFVRWEAACGRSECVSVVVTVHENPIPTITATPGTLACEPVLLEVDQVFANYLWQPGGEMTQSIVATSNGTYTVTVTDANGCSGAASVEVMADDGVDVQLSLQLEGFDHGAPAARCVRLVPDACADAIDLTLTFDATGLFSGIITLPCGSWSQLCAKDEQHTLWTTVGLSPGGPGLIADSTILLRGGDANNDGGVDINDVTFLFANYAVNVTPDADGCPWDGVPDGDFSHDGFVFSEDYTLLSGNWNAASGCMCAAAAVPAHLAGQRAVPQQRKTRVATAALATPMRRLDVNCDGWFDVIDVALLEQQHGLPHTLSGKIAAAEAIVQQASEKSVRTAER